MEQVHQPDEFVAVSEIEKSLAVLRRFIETLKARVSSRQPAEEDVMNLPPAQPIERIFVGPSEKTLGYAQIIRRGDHFYVSGMSHDGPDVETQMRGIYTDFFEMMRPYGVTSRNVVREVVYTTDIEALKKANPARKSFFPDDTYPTSSWIQIQRLLRSSDLLEIEFEVILD